MLEKLLQNPDFYRAVIEASLGLLGFLAGAVLVGVGLIQVVTNALSDNPKKLQWGTKPVSLFAWGIPLMAFSAFLTMWGAARIWAEGNPYLLINNILGLVKEGWKITPPMPVPPTLTPTS